MLTPRDAFKVGFLRRCIEDGLSIEQAHERVKVALDKLALFGELAKGVTEAGGKLLDTGINWGVPLALAGPPVLGGVAGYGLSKATDIDDVSVDEIKKREIIDELKRQTDRLHQDKRIRDYRAQRKQTGRIFM